MRLPMKALLAGALLLSGTLGAAAAAPEAASGDPAAAPDAAKTSTPADKLVLLFATGADGLDQQNQAILDRASRLYRDGHPIVMIVSGSTDSVGDATKNLLLSQRRANAVASGLRARGIPAERTEILAKGETNPAVEAPKGTAEPQNRRVEITWR